jgi:hypothetical protein
MMTTTAYCLLPSAYSPWRVIGASVTGTSHRAKALPCQDAHWARVLADGTLLAAVADGAGSATRGDEGARLVVQGAIAALTRRLDAALPDDEAGWMAAMIGAFREAHEALVAFATGEGIAIRSLATTLSCAVVTERDVVVGQLGDGAVVIEDDDGQLQTAVRPARGEYANETFFLTKRSSLDQVVVSGGPQPVRSLILTTDGLLRLAFKLPAYEPHLPFFRPLLGFLAEADDRRRAEADLSAFLNADRLSARTDDDKTLLLARRLAPDDAG